MHIFQQIFYAVLYTYLVNDKNQMVALIQGDKMPKDLLDEKEITLEKLQKQFQNKDFTQTALKPYSEYSMEEIEFHSEIRSYIYEHWTEILKDFGVKNPMSCFSKDYPPELIREYLEKLIADIVISVKRDEIAFGNIC